MRQGSAAKWYQRDIFYEISVRAFYDSNGDGIGDIQGLIEKLDYLQWLGVGCIWLLPIFCSPGRDGGYDVSDYYTIQSEYGSTEDVMKLLDEAHHRDIRIISDLVLNHTSNQHPWFQASRSSKDSPYRNWYIWNQAPNKYSNVPIIFKDTETSNWAFDELTGEYYFHRFYTEQPDLNYDNLEVQEAMIQVALHWMEVGFDGFRLDAVPFLFKREGTSCENLPETHTFLKRVRYEVDSRFKDKLLLAEAAMPPSKLKEYFGSGDECQMCFNFPVTGNIFRALAQAKSYPLVEAAASLLDIPEGCQWQIFLCNHDNLNFKMLDISEEEQKYLVNFYGPEPRMILNGEVRRRLAPLLKDDRRQIVLLNNLLLSLPGSPILYYGDEIGMGDNVMLDDRFGLRTPMQWTKGPTGGFSDAQSDRLFLPVVPDLKHNPDAVNVQDQMEDPDSLLRWIKRLIEFRRNISAFNGNYFEVIPSDNEAIFAFTRSDSEQKVICISNFSSHEQTARLNLRSLTEKKVTSLLEGTQLPELKGLDEYLINVKPYGFFWLKVED